MVKLKSTVPGLIYPVGRDYFLKTSFSFLEDRKKNDGAEGLWRIENNLYDLKTFVKSHPGGSEWISMTRGTDITEAFQVQHISDNAEKLLPKFYVRKAKTPRTLLYTFKPNGFYRKFKERVHEALKNVDIHSSTIRSKQIADSIVIMTILSVLATAIFKSWILITISALLLAWTTIAAHNFFHLKDNFRMYYFDLSTMSSKDWRVSHILSHHLYPNTIWDMEIYSFEPFFDYLPTKDTSKIYRMMSIIISPIIFCFVFLFQGIKRYYSIYVEWKSLEFRDIIPFFLPIIMSFFTSSSWEAIKLWLLILVLGSFFFSFIGLTAAHHHPDIFHDGDVCRKDLDWGLMELDAVRDRKLIDDSLFLILISFGSHGLHHLLPTVDHANLKLCLPAFYKTCQEFGVDCDNFSQWELIKGHYQQLVRVDAKLNYRGIVNVNAAL